MAVSASEALLALAAELAAGLATAAAVGSAHVGRDVALSSGGAVGCHRHGAAVNHCVRDRDGVTVRPAAGGRRLSEHVHSLRTIKNKVSRFFQATKRKVVFFFFSQMPNFGIKSEKTNETYEERLDDRRQ